MCTNLASIAITNNRRAGGMMLPVPYSGWLDFNREITLRVYRISGGILIDLIDKLSNLIDQVCWPLLLLCY